MTAAGAHLMELARQAAPPRTLNRPD